MSCISYPENSCFNSNSSNFRINLKRWTYGIAFVWFITLLAHSSELYNNRDMGSGNITSIVFEMICSVVFIGICYSIVNNINLSLNLNNSDVHLLSNSSKLLYILYSVFISIYMVINLIQFISVFTLLQPVNLILSLLLNIVWLFFSIIYIRYLWSYNYHIKNNSIE